jgi:hypothetical protein
MTSWLKSSLQRKGILYIRFSQSEEGSKNKRSACVRNRLWPLCERRVKVQAVNIYQECLPFGIVTIGWGRERNVNGMDHAIGKMIEAGETGEKVGRNEQ